MRATGSEVDAGLYAGHAVNRLIWDRLMSAWLLHSSAAQALSGAPTDPSARASTRPLADGPPMNSTRLSGREREGHWVAELLSFGSQFLFCLYRVHAIGIARFSRLRDFFPYFIYLLYLV